MLYEFNRKDLSGRAAMVWDYGRHIATRSESNNRILLYDMGRFFAEVWYGQEKNQIVQVIGFKSAKCLEPYLDLVVLNLD